MKPSAPELLNKARNQGSTNETYTLTVINIESEGWEGAIGFLFCRRLRKNPIGVAEDLWLQLLLEYPSGFACDKLSNNVCMCIVGVGGIQQHFSGMLKFSKILRILSIHLLREVIYYHNN